MMSLFLYWFPFTLLFLFRCRFRFLFPFPFLFRIPVSCFSRRPQIVIADNDVTLTPKAQVLTDTMCHRYKCGHDWSQT